MDRVTVRKLNHEGRELFAYPGRVARREDRGIVVEADWSRGHLDLGFVVLEEGDVFTEHFYADRWYNIFEIRSSDGRLKGWYCNIARPASISQDEVAADDLALDLWVAPDGSMRTLDEDELEALHLDEATSAAIKQAMEDLVALVKSERAPFRFTNPKER